MAGRWWKQRRGGDPRLDRSWSTPDMTGDELDDWPFMVIWNYLIGHWLWVWSVGVNCLSHELRLQRRMVRVFTLEIILQWWMFFKHLHTLKESDIGWLWFAYLSIVMRSVIKTDFQSYMSLLNGSLENMYSTGLGCDLSQQLYVGWYCAEVFIHRYW